MTGLLSEWLHLAGGGAMVAAAWLLPRRVALAPIRPNMALLLDIAPMALGALLLSLASGRPLFSGLILLALGAGFALADQTMRDTLHEPVVFSESVELPQVFTHPHLYLPFAGPMLVIGGTLGAIAVAAGLLAFEPPLWAPRPFTAALAAALILAAGWLVGREPYLALAARAARSLRPGGEPFDDAARLGPFAMVLVHCLLARAERAGLWRKLTPLPAMTSRPARPTPGPPRGPVVLVQCESFFDARRLSASLPDHIVGGFAAACRDAAQFGRLEVPGWGANTMRTEFAVLSGIPESELGYDRFNPYYALARRPLRSQVWRLRQAGYRTICLHPFDRRFFRRDVTLPALGFEQFQGRDTIGGSRKPPYFPDPELADRVLRVLNAEGPNCFIFVITMGNHGPWLENGSRLAPELDGILGEEAVPKGGDLLRYLDGLRRSDEMLRLLTEGLARRHPDAVLGFYGDHLPSLPKVFEHFGFVEPHSDYLIWRPDAAAAPRRLDLPAHAFGRAIVDLALAEPFEHSTGAAAMMRRGGVRV